MDLERLRFMKAARGFAFSPNCLFYSVIFQDKDEKLGKASINELLSYLDNYIQSPERDLDKPTLLPIESCYAITGRGTVVAGMIRRGTLKKGDQCEIIGYGKQFKVNVSGQYGVFMPELYQCVLLFR